MNANNGNLEPFYSTVSVGCAGAVLRRSALTVRGHLWRSTARMPTVFGPTWQQCDCVLRTSFAKATTMVCAFGVVGRRQSSRAHACHAVQNNGATLRLIKFAGTLPISYRGTVYHIPVTVWLPPAYPLQGPNLFVSPTADMAIKQQHQHVDSEGRCYLPSLSQWNPNNVQGMCGVCHACQVY